MSPCWELLKPGGWAWALEAGLWGCHLALLCTSCITFGKFLHFSPLPLLHLYNGASYNNYLREWLWSLNKLMSRRALSTMAHGAHSVTQWTSLMETPSQPGRVPYTQMASPKLVQCVSQGICSLATGAQGIAFSWESYVNQRASLSLSESCCSNLGEPQCFETFLSSDCLTLESSGFSTKHIPWQPFSSVLRLLRPLAQQKLTLFTTPCPTPLGQRGPCWLGAPWQHSLES